MDIEGIDSDEMVEETVSQNQYLKQLLTIKTMEEAKASPFLVHFYQGIPTLTPEAMELEFKIPNPKVKYKKEICAKVLKQGDLLVQCYDCRVDSSCVICLDCFKNGNHEGHRYAVRKAVGGCCDCGDKEAWKESGFCVQHTGKFQSFDIPQKGLQKARAKLHNLFYIYFYANIVKHYHRRQYSSILINFLVKLNTNSPYHNKITCQCLAVSLDEDLNPLLNGCTVLENILKYAISEQMIDKWLQLFMVMFAYYPFKLELLKVYMQKFGQLVNGSQPSFKCAGSISCQVMTSHQLIEKYCNQYDEGLGQNMKHCPELVETGVDRFRRYYIRLYYDLNYISKLSGTAPLTYWRMHINNHQGLTNLFKYYEDITQFAAKLQNMGDETTSILVQLVSLSSIEEEAVQNFAHILRVIRQDKGLMLKVLKYLCRKCEQYDVCSSQDSTIIFRPFERCLGMGIFAYFNSSLQQVNSQKEKLIHQVFQSNKERFIRVITRVLNKMIRTYLFYPRTIAQPGIGQSVYHYLYFYKIKYHFLFQVDVTSIKTFLLLLKGETYQPISFLSEVTNRNPKHKVTKVLFNSTMTFLRYLYTFHICQASVSAEINPQNQLYHQQTADLLCRFFHQCKGCVPMEKINLFRTKLFSDKDQFIFRWLKQNCSFNKQKKHFILNKEDNGKGLDFNDLWQNNLTESCRLKDPWKTKDVVTGLNQEIFEMVWDSQSIEILVVLFKKVYFSGQTEGIQAALFNILPIYLLKIDKPEQISSLEKQIILTNIDWIPPQLRTKLNQSKSIQVQQPDKIQPSLDEKNRKKSKLEEMKMRKLQQMKDKQKKFLDNQMEEEPMVKKCDSFESNFEKEEEKQICCICRSNKKQNLVYLVRVQTRNNEQILKLGKGVGCITYNSCNHAFDYQCLTNSVKGTPFVNLIRCPLCKTPAFFPLPLCYSGNQQFNNPIFQEIGRIAVEKPGFESIQQCIIQSFYHFVLLCYADIRNTADKRLQIYKLILQQLLQSFCSHQKGLQHSALTAFQKNLTSSKQNKDQGEKIEMEEKIIKIKNSKKQSKKQGSKIEPQRQKLKNLFELKQKQESAQSELNHLERHKVYGIQNGVEQRKFTVAMKIFIFFLKARLKGSQILENELQELKSSFKDKNFANFCQICFKVLFEQKLTEQELNFLQKSKKPKQFQVLKKLPQKYSQYRAQLVCSCCKQTTANMTECLLCDDWVGCQHCISGKTLTHNVEIHSGGIGIYMQIQSSTAFYQSSYGVSIVGPLYENVWGKGPQRSNKWEQFELSYKKIKEIEDTLVYDKPINKYITR